MKVILILIIFLNLSFTNDRFKNINNIVVDNEMDVMWQSTTSSKKFSWNEAKSYCNSLNYDGYNDWRVPYIDELINLTDKFKYEPSIITNLIKVNVDNLYWSATEYENNSSYAAWLISFKDGDDYWTYKVYKYYILCIRNNKK